MYDEKKVKILESMSEEEVKNFLDSITASSNQQRKGKLVIEPRTDWGIETCDGGREILENEMFGLNEVQK